MFGRNKGYVKQKRTKVDAKGNKTTQRAYTKTKGNDIYSKLSTDSSKVKAFDIANKAKVSMARSANVAQAIAQAGSTLRANNNVYTGATTTNKTNSGVEAGINGGISTDSGNQRDEDNPLVSD